jgi:uncharacterized membrane protein (UPF0136 family)
MTSDSSTTGRDLVIALLLLSGVSVGGPLFFPRHVSVEDSGLLLGAVFSALLLVAFAAKLVKAAMGIGRVVLIAVVLGIGFWGLYLYNEHQENPDAAAAQRVSATRDQRHAGAVQGRLAAEAENTSAA